MASAKRTKVRRAAVKAGFRSGFEAAVAAGLTTRGIAFEYENLTFKLEVPAGRKFKCPGCELVYSGTKPLRYTPDFVIETPEHPERILVIETKGRFTARDRKVALAMERIETVDYHLLFQRNNRLAKGSNTTYVEWCTENGITCAVGTHVPSVWLK